VHLGGTAGERGIPARAPVSARLDGTEPTDGAGEPGRMVKFPAASPDTLARFDSLAPHDEGITRKLMFGFPAAFAHGNMFFGVFGDVLFLRLSEADRKLAVQTHRMAAFEPMKGRPMREYVALPPAVLDRPDEASVWIRRSFDWVSTLPPKPGDGAAGRSRRRKGSSVSATRAPARRDL
jgi:TfoX/Sxy family transcriptional regulator of competence genes